jgi:hypothetical protein
VTDRQRRLLAWMRDPQHPDLPTHEAIRWQDSLWPVSALVKLTGIEGYTYARCRRDLEALREQNLVNPIVPGRWRVGALS